MGTLDDDDFDDNDNKADVIGRDEEEPNNDDEDNRNETMNRKHTKKKKMNPFSKSIEKGILAKQQKEEYLQHKEQANKDKLRKLKARKQQTKLLSQRTAKGQPIMKNTIHNILYKLEKQKQQEAETANARPSSQQSYRNRNPRYTNNNNHNRNNDKRRRNNNGTNNDNEERQQQQHHKSRNYNTKIAANELGGEEVVPNK